VRQQCTVPIVAMFQDWLWLVPFFLVAYACSLCFPRWSGYGKEELARFGYVPLLPTLVACQHGSTRHCAAHTAPSWLLMKLFLLPRAWCHRPTIELYARDFCFSSRYFFSQFCRARVPCACVCIHRVACLVGRIVLHSTLRARAPHTADYVNHVRRRHA
jgi:hypothetical protein